jgi:D-glycero-D-manno-heptose 1,7-bisphosphate phosphatase
MAPHETRWRGRHSTISKTERQMERRSTTKHGDPTTTTKARFVLLDRDGTIIEECEYLSDPEQLRLLPGVAAALRELRKMGLGLVVITNQSGVGRGYFDQNRLLSVHERLVELLAAEGIQLDGIYVCPHTPDDECSCRKPKTALAERASAELGFDLQACFVIGDKRSDIEMGQNIGAVTLLVRTGYGDRERLESETSPDYVVRDLQSAVRIIRRLCSEPRSLG